MRWLIILLFPAYLFAEDIFGNNIFSPFYMADLTEKKPGKCDFGGTCVCTDCKICPKCKVCPECPECPEFPECVCAKCPVCETCKHIKCGIKQRPLPLLKTTKIKKEKHSIKYVYRDELMGQLYCIYGKDRKRFQRYTKYLERVIKFYENQIREYNNKLRKKRYCRAFEISQDLVIDEIEKIDTGLYIPDTSVEEN